MSTTSICIGKGQASWMSSAGGIRVALFSSGEISPCCVFDKGYPMPSLLQSTVVSSSVKRLAMAVLVGTAVLASPRAPAYAQTGTSRPAPTRAANPAQTVDQRIDNLHAALKITPAEEADWQGVAQTMRDNAAAMQKLAAAKAGQSRHGMTAIEDLQTYAQFAQLRVEGLKNLTTSFQTLYDSMPDQQKKLADQVFQNSRRQEASRRG